MADLSVLTNRVAIYAPAAPDPLILEMLREAADELCTRTRAWIVEPDAIDIEIGEARYSVAIEATQLPVEIIELRLDGVRLEPENLPDWTRSAAEWPASTGLPTKYALVAPNEVVLNALPAAAGSLQFKVAVKPARASTRVADWLVADQQDALVAGALARLLLLPNRPWTGPDLAAIHAGTFNEKVSALSWRAAKGFAASGPTARPRFL